MRLRVRFISPRTRGFTLIELMMTVGVLAILVAIAAPNVRESMLNARMSGYANDLMADLNIARSEAVKRGVNVYVCSSNDATNCTSSEWTQGWLIFVDTSAGGLKTAGEPTLKAHGPLGPSANLSSTGHILNGGARYVRFRPSGASNVAGASVVFTLCDLRYQGNTGIDANRAAGRGRTIEVTPTGRPQVTPRTCTSATS